VHTIASVAGKNLKREALEDVAAVVQKQIPRDRDRATVGLLQQSARHSKAAAKCYMCKKMVLWVNVAHAIQIPPGRVALFLTMFFQSYNEIDHFLSVFIKFQA
jgi:hypothetical protein